MVHLMLLTPNDPVYREAEKFFRTGWKHTDRAYRLHNIFYVVYEGPAAQLHLHKNRAYLQQVTSRTQKPEQYLFHGTQRACSIGDDPAQVRPCEKPNCYFCQILKCSYSVARVGNSSLFGKGIYTSSVSSNADGFVWNEHIHSPKHIMFLSNVVTGNPEKAYQPQQNRTGPNPGFDSVEAVTRANGGSVEHPQTIVYREDAVLPSVVIVYSRQHRS